VVCGVGEAGSRQGSRMCALRLGIYAGVERMSSMAFPAPVSRACSPAQYLPPMPIFAVPCALVLLCITAILATVYSGYTQYARYT
jgi:hypothetical protein